MQIGKIQYKKKRQYFEISADFTFRNPMLNQRVWFQLPTQYASKEDAADAFLIAAYPLALTLNEDIFYNGTVSESLHDNLLRSNALLNLPERKIRINVKKRIRRERKLPLSSKVGLFFTSGVDSFYSLLRDYSLKKKNKIGYLISIYGLDLYQPTENERKEASKKYEHIATSTKTKSITINTNLRSLSDKIMNWKFFHGAAIASCGMLLFPFLTKIYISSGDNYSGHAWGTHTLLDNLWSNELVQFTSYAISTKRVNKVRTLCRSSKKYLVYKYLQVCWQPNRESYLVNCSRCQKCIRCYLTFRVIAGKKVSLPFTNPSEYVLRHFDIVHSNVDGWLEIFPQIKKKEIIDPVSISVIEKKLFSKKRFAFIKDPIRNMRYSGHPQIRRVYEKILSYGIFKNAFAVLLLVMLKCLV